MLTVVSVLSLVEEYISVTAIRNRNFSLELARLKDQICIGFCLVLLKFEQ